MLHAPRAASDCAPSPWGASLALPTLALLHFVFVLPIYQRSGQEVAARKASSPLQERRISYPLSTADPPFFLGRISMCIHIVWCVVLPACAFLIWPFIFSFRPFCAARRWDSFGLPSCLRDTPYTRRGARRRSGRERRNKRGRAGRGAWRRSPRNRSKLPLRGPIGVGVGRIDSK